MGGRTKRAIRSECDRFETDAEVLVLDGLVRAAVLGGSVAIGAEGKGKRQGNQGTKLGRGRGGRKDVRG